MGWSHWKGPGFYEMVKTRFPLLASVPNDLGRTLQTTRPTKSMERGVLHWSAGHYTPNPVDLHSYHYLILNDGSVKLGDHGVFNNARPILNGDYAAHVLGLNNGSIGVSMCGMWDATGPRDLGSAPLTAAQWRTAVTLFSELSDLFFWPIDRHHILGHFEVDEEYHIKQGRWDPFTPFPDWPWSADLSPKMIAELFRNEVSANLDLKINTLQ